MANWTPVFVDDLEKKGDQDNFFDQGAPEVTIPCGYHVVWDGVRPEFDKKDATIGQPEVYSGEQAGVGFHVFRTFKWWLISDPIDVTPGLNTRGQAALMVVSHGIGGDEHARGACGMRVGLMNADEITIDADKLAASPQDADAEGLRVAGLIEAGDVTWSKWYVVRGDTDTPEREWGIKRTKKMIPSGGAVRLIIQCNADVAAQISAGHYDDLLVEQNLPAGSMPPLDRQRLLAIAATLRAQADLLTELAGGEPADLGTEEAGDEPADLGTEVTGDEPADLGTEVVGDEPADLGTEVVVGDEPADLGTEVVVGDEPADLGTEVEGEEPAVTTDDWEAPL